MFSLGLSEVPWPGCRPVCVVRENTVNPLMDGHPHMFSTDSEQTLQGGHLTRRGVVCPRVPLGT
jgi:hypothetical protein